MSTINERISAIIKEKGITRTAFAEQLNLSQSYVSAICVGRKTPSSRTISDISQKFGISETWIRTGEGNMDLNNPEYDQAINNFVSGGKTFEDKEFRQRFISAINKLEEPELKMVFRVVNALVAEQTGKPVPALTPDSPVNE